MYLRALVLAAFVVLLVTTPALAQEAETLEGLIVQLYDGAVRIVGLAAFLMILFAGMVRMGIIPGKSPEESTSIIVDAVVGTVLLLSSVLILGAINPDLIQQDSPVLDPSRYEDIEPAGTSGGASNISSDTRTIQQRVLDIQANTSGNTSAAGGNILPIFVQ